MVVLEQLLHHVERLAAADGEKVAADRGLRQQRVALGLRQRLGVTLRDQNARGDFLGAPVPVAKRLGVLLREPRHVGDGLLAVAPEHQSRAVAMRLAELVARGDVGDAVFEAQILEPRRLGNVEMVDGVEVVIEPGRRGLFGHQPAAIFEAAVDQEHVQSRFGEITAENEAMMAGADDDPVIGLVQSLGHAVLPKIFCAEGTPNLSV